MTVFSRLQGPARRLAIAALLVSVLSAGCAVPERLTSPTLVIPVGTAVVGTVAEPAAGPRLRVELEDDESFVSVAPSGELIVTERPDQLCLRTGAELADRACLPVGAGNTTWNLQWSPDGTRLAAVRTGAHSGGQQNDSLWVLNVPDRTLQAVTPLDSWLAETPIPFWWDEDTLGYLWSPEGHTALHRWTAKDGEAAVRQLSGVRDLQELRIERLLGSGPDGLLLHADVDRNRGIYRLTPDGELTQVRRTGENDILAVDPGEQWIVTQFPDTHYPGPPTLVDLTTGDESEAKLPGNPITLSPNGTATAGVAARAGSLRITATPWPVTPGSAASGPAWIAATEIPDRTYLYDGIAWTASHLVAPLQTDGEPEVVLVFDAPDLGR